MEREKLKKINVRKVVVCVVIAIIVAVAGLVMYSENVHEIGFIENIKHAIEEQINPNSETNQVDATIGVDVTDIVNDDYVEHEHIWYDEYDETNHWRKCSICNAVEEMEEHTLILPSEAGKCGVAYTVTCECGYSTTEIKQYHTWNGTWQENPDGQNMHQRVCATCGANIGSVYIDNTNGGKLVDNSIINAERTANGFLPINNTCVLTDGSPRPCDSSEPCAECGGPYVKDDRHAYEVKAKDNKIRCSRCGKERRNI